MDLSDRRGNRVALGFDNWLEQKYLRPMVMPQLGAVGRCQFVLTSCLIDYPGPLSETRVAVDRLEDILKAVEDRANTISVSENLSPGQQFEYVIMSKAAEKLRGFMGVE